MNSSNRPSAMRTFTQFLVLGMTSFGGPTAHLGFFRNKFVQQTQQLTDPEYAQLVAFTNALPGPTSSQIGMLIGLRAARYKGLIAAWLGFTLPSAIIMGALGYGLTTNPALTELGWLTGILAGTVGIVAAALLSMGRTLTPDLPRVLIAAAVAAITLWNPAPYLPVALILGAGIIGARTFRAGTFGAGTNGRQTSSVRKLGAATISPKISVISGLILATLLVGGPLLAHTTQNSAIKVLDSLFRAGALVFGGGHVVLPMLQNALAQPGLLESSELMAGYAAAQAVPGPLFTIATYVGVTAETSLDPLVMAVLATIAIFLPSILLIIALLPLWNKISTNPQLQGAMQGINASVVGLLTASLITPVISHGITNLATGAVAIGTFLTLTLSKIPAWAVVLGTALIGATLL